MFFILLTLDIDMSTRNNFPPNSNTRKKLWKQGDKCQLEHNICVGIKGSDGDCSKLKSNHPSKVNSSCSAADNLSS